jgi:hypothetical protein
LSKYLFKSLSLLILQTSTIQKFFKLNKKKIEWIYTLKELEKTKKNLRKNYKQQKMNLFAILSDKNVKLNQQP